LYKPEKDVREQACPQYVRDLTRAEDADQIKILSKAIKKHLEQYPKHIEGDFSQWKIELDKL